VTAGVRLLERTFPTPAENLACDEALLDAAEAADGPALLRFWEAPEPFVVLGLGNRLPEEVNEAACRERKIPILRRCSGGGTVVQGPGCLSYALILKADESGPLRTITSTNAFIMERHRQALRTIMGNATSVEGVTDLALGAPSTGLGPALKFSGNAQRRRREWLLFHGTFLYDFDLELISALLRLPSRQPDYRQGRAHRDFLTQLAVGRQQLQRALSQAWGVIPGLVEVPEAAIAELVGKRYGTDGWTKRC
jgi:lipoate-protein ligase A